MQDRELVSEPSRSNADRLTDNNEGRLVVDERLAGVVEDLAARRRRDDVADLVGSAQQPSAAAH